MTQKEQIGIIVKRVNIMDEQLKSLRILLNRIEDRLIAIEEAYESTYREHREVVFESDFSLEDPYGDDEDDDEE